jgi:zinc transporter ZupT
MDVSIWHVFVAALVTAVATGLGAVPFAFTSSMSRRWLGFSNAVAGGVMLGASVGLVREGAGYSVARTAVGALAGVVFIVAVRRALGWRGERTIGALRGADALKALLIVGVMTAHSFTEGVGIGVSYGGGEELGVFITLAIAVHNIPEGLAISLVLVPRGVSVLAAAGWCVFSSLPQPLMAVPAFVFVEAFEPVLPAGLGFAAGAMVWMVLAELLPEARKAAPARTVAVTGILSLAGMVAFQELVL